MIAHQRVKRRETGASGHRPCDDTGRIRPAFHKVAQQDDLGFQLRPPSVIVADHANQPVQPVHPSVDIADPVHLPPFRYGWGGSEENTSDLKSLMRSTYAV